MSVDFIIKKELIKFNSFYPVKEACYILTKFKQAWNIYFINLNY